MPGLPPRKREGDRPILSQLKDNWPQNTPESQEKSRITNQAQRKTRNNQIEGNAQGGIDYKLFPNRYKSAGQKTQKDLRKEKMTKRSGQIGRPLPLIERSLFLF
jgi:hypothetical protein